MRIVCASLPGPGHAYPMLAVAEALARREHEVVFVSGREHAEDAARAGASFLELPSAGGSPFEALRPYDDAVAQAEAFRPALAGFAPAAVVADVLTLSPALAAESLGIPHATLVIHGLHLPSRALPPFGWGGPPGRTPFGRLRDRWMRRGKLSDLERARAELNRARARLGLAPTERLDAQVSPHLTLVATLPSLEVPRPDWPEFAHVVGPCLWEPDGTPPAPPPGNGPLVLVAASTAHAGPALLRATCEAVRRLGLRAIVTVGAGEPPARLSPRVVAARFAPHGPILAHADAVVCSGGHGVVARSLSAGVPLVVAPGHGDQRENAWRVARSGAGLQVRRPTATRIRRALGRVLSEPSFRAAARRIAAEAASMDGPARAAALIEELGVAGLRESGAAPNDGGRAGARPPPERRSS